MDLEHIVDASNRIHELLLETTEPDRTTLEKAFSIACNSLRRVTDDVDSLQRDLDHLARLQQQSPSDYRAICSDVNHFVNGFCVIEKRVLVAAGIKEWVADALLDQAKAVRRAIVNIAFDPQRVRRDIVAFRDGCCDVAKRLHDLPLEEQERRTFVKRIKRTAAGIGGLAFVGINAASIAASLGLSAPGAVSGAMGSGLVGAALVVD